MQTCEIKMVNMAKIIPDKHQHVKCTMWSFLYVTIQSHHSQRNNDVRDKCGSLKSGFKGTHKKKNITNAFISIAVENRTLAESSIFNILIGP